MADDIEHPPGTVVDYLLERVEHNPFEIAPGVSVEAPRLNKEIEFWRRHEEEKKRANMMDMGGRNGGRQ